MERSLRLAQKLVRRKLAHIDLDEKVINAALQARKQIDCVKAEFGDCSDVSKRTVAILREEGISAKVVGGEFIANPGEEEEWDHSWVMVGSEILDPTVDQFFSSLDVDLITEVPGVYYSSIDGDWLRNRYRRSGGRQSAAIDPDQPESDDLRDLLIQLRQDYPGLRIYAYESARLIELMEIEVANKGQGVGTQVIKKLQEYARRVGKPIVLRPHPEPRKKTALFRFYKNLGFVMNKGRNMDYTLSSPFALTMYWKP